MSLVILTRVMKYLVMLAEAAQILWLAANAIRKHKHGYVAQNRYLPRTQ